MNDQIPNAIQQWHAALAARDVGKLDSLLADDVIFYSPIVFSPQVGKGITKQYLTAALFVLGGDHFRYVREVYGASDAVLEFETELDGIYVNGVDMITWNDEDRIVSFKVMIRPLQAVNKIHQLMAAMLAQMAGKGRPRS